VKDVLSRFGFSDFLTLVCPGLLVLLSFAVWIPESVWQNQLREIDPKKLDSVLLAVLIVVLAYAFGLVASVLASEIAIWRAYLVSRPEARLLWPFTGFLWLLQGTLDFPLRKMSVVTTLLTLGGRLAELSGGEDRLPISPYELVNAYRVFVSGQAVETARPLVDEAEQVCRRRIFGQGMALVLALLAVQAVCVALFRRWHPVVFALIAFLAVLASFGLRLAAARLWEQELLYTYRLYLLVSPEAGWTPNA
jgi:hypothetical protein